MHPNAELKAALARYASVRLPELLLNGHGALHGINDAWELGQDAVAYRVGDSAPMLGNEAVHDLAMRRERAKRRDLVLAHQARVPGHVGGKDCRQPALDPLC